MKDALLVNWDSYPNFAFGGIYTWEKNLIETMADWRFFVINILSNPNSNKNYAIAPNVKQVIEIPIFGSHRYEEFYNDTTNLLAKISQTRDSVIKKKFIPLFHEFLRDALLEDTEPEQFCETIFRLHKFLGIYDSKKCLEHPLTWEAFLEFVDSDPIYRNMVLKSCLTAFQMIQRNLQFLSIEIPKTDIIHCSLAWLPSLIAISGKMENNCPVILTEHGVAFRELLLYYSAYLYDEPSKIFARIFSRNIVRAVYFTADYITPVCNANAYWERMLGADESKIRVIYNGIDVHRFRPLAEKHGENPVVACVGRVDAFKDIVCLLNAIEEARKQEPSIKCRIYGTATDLDYAMRCIRTVRNLKLENNVQFMGQIKEPEKAYNSADVVVFSSITEGFPFSIIEAMACGRPVVASDVGGVREALEGCGLLVKSRRPTELANAIITLLRNKKLGNELAVEAMKRAHEKFTLQQSMQAYRFLYEEALRSQKLVENQAVLR